MAINIQIGTTSDDPRKVSKSHTLNSPISCTLRGDVDIENPVLEVAANDSYITANYAYIPAWNRYYFFSKAPTVSSAGRMILHLTEDYLMSYASQLTGKTFYVTRSSNFSNPMIPDTGFPTEIKPIIDVHGFGNALVSSNGYTSKNFLLITN